VRQVRHSLKLVEHALEEHLPFRCGVSTIRIRGPPGLPSHFAVGNGAQTHFALEFDDMFNGGILCCKDISARALTLLEKDTLVIEILGSDKGANVLDTEGGRELERRHGERRHKMRVYIHGKDIKV
jgi:hypothetical protein